MDESGVNSRGTRVLINSKNVGSIFPQHGTWVDRRVPVTFYFRQLYKSGFHAIPDVIRG